MVLIQHMHILLISINCSEFFSPVFSGQNSQIAKEENLKYVLIDWEKTLYNPVKSSTDEIQVSNKMY